MDDELSAANTDLEYAKAELRELRTKPRWEPLGCDDYGCAEQTQLAHGINHPIGTLGLCKLVTPNES